MKIKTNTTALVAQALRKLNDDEIQAILDHQQEKLRYNGWTNYATWRVCLEMDLVETFSRIYDKDTIPGKLNLAYEIKDYIEEQINIATNESNNFAYFYAMAFVEDVNTYEIATHIIEDIKFNGGE